MLLEEYLCWSVLWIQFRFEWLPEEIAKNHDRHQWDIRIAKFWMTTEFDPYLEVTHSHHSTLLWCQWCLQWSDSIVHRLFWPRCELHCLHQQWSGSPSLHHGRNQWIDCLFVSDLECMFPLFGKTTHHSRWDVSEQAQIPTMPRVQPKLASDEQKRNRNHVVQNLMQSWQPLCVQQLKPLYGQNLRKLSRQFDVNPQDSFQTAWEIQSVFHFATQMEWWVKYRFASAEMQHEFEMILGLSLGESRSQLAILLAHFHPNSTEQQRNAILFWGLDCLQCGLCTMQIHLQQEPCFSCEIWCVSFVLPCFEQNLFHLIRIVQQTNLQVPTMHVCVQSSCPTNAMPALLASTKPSERSANDARPSQQVWTIWMFHALAWKSPANLLLSRALLATCDVPHKLPS